MPSPNPRVGAPFSDGTVAKIKAFQESGADNVYKCKDTEHTLPLEVNKLSLRCPNCRYEQRYVHMFLGERNDAGAT